jgi:hypothetical protein
MAFSSGEVKRTIDPFRTVDLADYLKVAPYLGGVCYLVALAIQQKIPELFVFAYPGAVFAFALPAIFIILTR